MPKKSVLSNSKNDYGIVISIGLTWRIEIFSIKYLELTYDRYTLKLEINVAVKIQVRINPKA